MNPERDISPVEQFAKIYAERESLEQRLQDTPELLADLLQQGLDEADTRLAELAKDPEVRDYYIKLGGEVTRVARELDELEPTLRQFGLEEQIEAKRRQIEEMYSGSNMRAARYYLRLSGVEVLATDDDTAVQIQPTASETREKGKPDLTILIDPHNNISINSKVVSLNRDLQIAGKVGAEAAGRQLRVDVLKFLAENPGQAFRASEIWDAIRPRADVNFNVWNLYCKPFFKIELTYKRKPIIKVDKVRPRLFKYSLEDFNLMVEETDKVFNIADETIFTLPNGNEIGGKGGKLLHMLNRATADKPVVRQDVIDRLYTIDELSKLKNQRSVLSALVSVARQEIQGTNLSIIKVLTDEKDPETNYRYPGYYMEGLEPEDEPLTLHEATVLAGFLVYHQDKLVRRGLDPMPVSIFEGLNEKVVETYANGEKTSADLHTLRSLAFEKAMTLLGASDERQKNALDSFDKKGDPRTDLLIHLLSYSTAEQVAYIKQLLEAHPELEVTFDAGRRKGFQVVKVKTSTVGSDGSEL